MKTISTLLILLATTPVTYAATGSRSGDEFVLFGPLAILAFVGLVHLIKELIREYRAKHTIDTNQ